MSPGQTAQGLRAQTDRTGLIALGRAGRSWEYVPAALAWLGAHAADSDVLVLLAASYGRLGLRTAGNEVFAGLAPHAARTPAAMAVRTMLAALPDDHVPLDQLASRARANARAMTGADARTLAAAEHAAAWWQNATLEVFRCGDGNFVAREKSGVWVRWGDLKSAAIEALREVASRPGSAAGAAPVYLDGVANPWVLRRAFEVLPRAGDGSWPALIAVEKNIGDLAWALGTLDLGELLGQERTHVFAGEDGLPRCERWLKERLDLALAGAVVGGSAGLAGVVERALAEQSAAMDAARRDIGANYTPSRANGAASWSARFQAAMSPGGEPLRVLIPTTRFSTFLQHSVRDLASALGRAGCEVRILEEPADHWRLAALAGARAVAAWRPDLIVSLNWPRTSLGAAAPAHVPFVMFVQDAMPHLFSKETGRSLGKLDYILGHLYGQWFLDFDYPRARTLQCPVLVNGEKFHARPADPGLAREHACEVAYVSHQSETPEACRDRLIAESRAAGSGGAMPAIIEELWPRIVAMTDAALTCWDHPSMLATARTAIERVTKREPEAAAVMLTVNSVIKVLGDRLIRHRTLEWAADICRRRSWRLRIHGRGWEKHPALAEFARGALAHGEALRASYQAAAVHLHASSGWMLHQRVMECAMSGGLPLVRLKREDVQALVGYTEATVGARIAQRPELDPGGDRWADIADHPEGLALAAQMQRVGLPPQHTVFVERDIPTKPWLAWEGSGAAARGMPYEAAWLLGDWSQTTFSSSSQLEQLVQRAVERPQWRSDLSAGIAARVRRRFTYDAMAARLLDFMARTLPGERA